ncbi:perilipin-3-like isoform X2 [Mauremys mutica]|nr:perilipin-3-like isoform X2 [Mauremys mutica]XP_044847307.1 perilipin-3-like isoform X2 [Mauremys mutica]XP_044847315.1 perilipin-3-like isoform X2 [Mauremys mutica]XP_044847321.1 perilipin-3-like isoform X2 [Mauremys mutica]XP_044847331.1 perilipin-3-like isoform X2 [Mauremys mutica]
MSSKTTKLDVASSENWEQKKQCNVLKKPSGLPFVSTVCHLVSTKYTSIKKRHLYNKSLCTGEEKGVKTINEVAVSSVQPVLNTLEPQPATVNCKGLESVEEKLPILCQTADQLASDVKDFMRFPKGKGENDAVIIGAVGLTKEAIQTNMETPKSAVINVKPTVFAERHGMASAQRQQDYDSYWVCLGSMMTKFQQCAYQHSQSKVRDAGQRLWEALQTSSLLLKYCIIALINTITQPLKTIYQILLVIIEHFPVNFQDKMQQVSHTTEVLHASVSTLDSFQDLSRQILSQIWEKVTKEEEHMNELLEYVVYSTPLCWFVGPFNALRGRT